MRLFFKKSLLFLPVLVLLMGGNWWLDPAHVFRQGSHERGIADLILRGSNVTNVIGYDDRILLRYYLADVPERRDVIAFGSSRSMLLRSAQFQPETFFNNSVSAAMLEDHMAIYSMYRVRGMFPSRIVLSIDPWNFNRYSDATRWEVLEPEYAELRRQMPASSADAIGQASYSQWSRYAQIFSPAYFQFGMRTLFDGSRKDGAYYAPQDLEDSHLNGLTILADGSIIFDRRLRSKPASEVATEAIAYGRMPTLSRSFTAVDPELSRKFEFLLDTMTGDGARVELMLAPFHPVAYRTMLETDPNKMVQRVESYLRQVANDKKIDLIGSFDPGVVCLGPTDFYDPYHPTEDAINRLIDGRSCAR